MKTLIKLIIIGSLGLSACNQENKEITESIAQDSIQKATDKNLVAKKEQAEFEQKQIRDSIYAEKVLKKILDTTTAFRRENVYNFKSDSIEVYYGNIFSKKQKHLLVKQNLETGLNINILKLTYDSFTNVYKRTEWYMTYINDTIRDVDGDGNKDYLFHWYPLSGCCPRDIYDVYLLKPTGGFSERYEFINPIFDSKEKVIRGMCYGYNAPLYKYKWNKFSVDTIEYIYFPDSTNNFKYVRRKHDDLNEKGQNLKDLPLEYKKIGYSIDSKY